jgi:hypothetical protein
MSEQVVLESFLSELEKIAKASTGAGDFFFSSLKRSGGNLMKDRTRVVRSKKITPGSDDAPSKTREILEFAPIEGLSSADLAKYYTGRALRSVGKGGEKVERYARENPATAVALGLGAAGTGIAGATLLGGD